VKIEIRRLGQDGRHMVGILQHRLAGVSPRPSFLLCRPIGQEATRTAAMYRVLSDRLARAGCDVLTFDYHGTGDSPGEEADQHLQGWISDVLAAHAALRTDDGPAVHWFAMGLGATIAALAAARAARPPSCLVLWEPVLDGPAYLNALFAAHRNELAREFQCSWDRLLRRDLVEEPKVPGDVLGFVFGEALSAELLGLRTVPLAPALRRGIRMLCGVRETQQALLATLCAASHGLLRLEVVESEVDWMSSQAMGTAIVPPDVQRVLMSTLGTPDV
jgi:uncharacterized protein